MFENKSSNVVLIDNREIGDQQDISHANKAQSKFQDRWSHRISLSNVL